MVALTKSRAVKSIPGVLFSYPVLANVTIHQGALVAITSAGWARPAITATGLTAVGIARHSVNSTGLANGAVSVEVEEMIADFDNSANADLITVADIGKKCFIVDDQTVAKTDGTGTRSPAGVVKKIESGRVFVTIEAAPLP